MKKRHTKFRVLFSTDNQAKAQKYFDNLKSTDGVTIYHRRWKDKDKSRYYVREVVRQGSKG
jgi:hypothetical protein